MNLPIVHWTFDNCLTSVMLDKMTSQQMFTAFDITQASRAAAPNEHISHQQVKSFVHNSYPSMSIASYERTSCVLSNGERAYVYHPQGADPTEYSAPVKALPFTPTDLSPFDDGDVIEGDVVDGFVNDLQGGTA